MKRNRLASQLLLLALFSLITTFSRCLALETEVVMVQIVFRHGDRTPVMPYPNDKYKESTWEKYGGFGQLTQAGMNRHYEYGQFLRNRYSNVFNKIYNRNRVLVRSTDYDRTLMSASALLSGLFEPVDYQVWNRDIKWQPIPIHTTEENNDNIFYSTPCPRLVQLRDDVRKTDEFIKLNDEYKDLLQILDKYSGYNDVNLETIWKVADDIFIEKINGLQLPDWAEANYKQMRNASSYGFYFDFRSVESGKLVSGGILREMRKNLIERVKPTNHTNYEIMLFSSHDTYVAGMMKLLEITPLINQPPFASSVTIELRRSTQSRTDYYVQIYLKNNTIDEPISMIELNMKGCDSLCPLDKFLQLTENLVVHDIQKECNVKLDNETLDEVISVSVIGFVLTIVLIISIISVATYKRIRSKAKPISYRSL